MSTEPPMYVARIARLPRVFAVLSRFPEGRRLESLAEDVGIPPDELREDLLAFYAADVGPDLLLGLSRPETIEFLAADGDDDVDPNDAEVVRLVDERPADELGVEYVDASELAKVYTAAVAIYDQEQDNQTLAEAIDVLAETMLGDASLASASHESYAAALGPLKQGQSERRAVQVVYSRAWAEGVSSRVIEPYRLVQTRRGWEVDAGPADADGRLRTYLVSNVRQATTLDVMFAPPDDLEGLLAAQRTTQRVRLYLHQDARWVPDMYAEHVEVVAEDEFGALLDVDLLPPVQQRVGLLMLAAGGEDDYVDGPADLVGAKRALAADLLAHHRATPRP